MTTPQADTGELIRLLHDVRDELERRGAFTGGDEANLAGRIEDALDELLIPQWTGVVPPGGTQ